MAVTKVRLTTQVQDVLPQANGGTGTTSLATTASGPSSFNPTYPDDLTTGTPAMKTVNATAYTVPASTRAYVMSIYGVDASSQLDIKTVADTARACFFIASSTQGVNASNTQASSSPLVADPVVFNQPFLLNAGDKLQRGSGGGSWGVNVVELSTFSSNITTVCQLVRNNATYTVTSGKVLYILGVYCEAGVATELNVDGVDIAQMSYANYAQNRSGADFNKTFMLASPIVVAAGKVVKTNSNTNAIHIWGYERTV